MHSINEIMRHEPMYCTPETRIAEIKHLLKKYDFEEILVVDNEKEKHPIGFISMEDVSGPAIEESAIPSDMSAIECMRSMPAVICENSSFEECLSVMRANHMNRIPVVDLNGHIAGMVEREELVRLMM